MKLPISYLIVSLSIFIITYININNRFCSFGCISWYEISSSSFGDIIFHWYLEIANLIFDCLSLNLHVYIYISYFLFWRISWYGISSSSFGDIIFHWYHEIANLEFDRLSLSLFFSYLVFLFFSFFSFLCSFFLSFLCCFYICHDMEYRLLLLAI